MKGSRQGFKQLLAGSVAGRFIGAVANIGLSRSLGIASFGSFSLYLQLIQAAEMLCRLGLDYSLSFWAGKDPAFRQDRTKRLAQAALQLNVLLSITTLLACSIYISTPSFGFPWPSNGSPPHILRGAMLAAITCECLASSLWDIVLIQRRMKMLSLRSGFFGPLKIACAAIGGLAYGLDGAMIGWLVGSALQLFWLARTTPLFGINTIMPTPSWLASVRRLIKKGLPFYANNLIGQLVFFPLVVSLSTAAGIQSVGILKVGQISAQIFGLLGGALVPVLFLSLRSEENADNKSVIMNKTLGASWSISLVVFSLFCLLDKQVLGLIFGQEYVAGASATRILVACVVIDSLAQIIQQSLLAEGRVKELSVCTNLTAVVCALLGWRLIPLNGLSGYLLCRLIYSVLPMFCTIYLANYFQARLRIDLRLVIASALMLAIVLNAVVGYQPIEGGLGLIILAISLGLGLSCAIEQARNLGRLT